MPKVFPDECLMPAFIFRGVTFGQIFSNDQSSSSVVNNFCPSAGRFVSAQRQACEAGTQYCWMSCLDLDEGCPAEEQVRVLSSPHFNFKPCRKDCLC